MRTKIKFRDKAIRLIRLYKREIDRTYSKMSLRRDMYYKYAIRWAINDLLEYILARPETPVFLAVEEYAKMMDNYSCKNVKYSYVFSVANDVAISVLDMLYSHA